MPPQRLAVAGEHGGAVQLVGPAGQRKESTACGLHVGRLVELLAGKRQRLVAAEHQGARPFLADAQRLGLRQDQRDILRRRAGALERQFDGALVDLGRHGLDGDTGVFQHGPAEGTCRGEDDGFGHVCPASFLLSAA